MPTTTVAYRTTIGLIWGLALWHSWESRGLFVDGSAFLVQIARREWFFDFYAPRLYAMVVGQAPIMTAVFLGITDLHLLARLLSIGLFALPTALYTLALVRVKDDPVLLAAVIGAIGLVFMTTSFFIVGEYNTAFAIAIVVAVRLVTAERLTVLDGLFLAVHQPARRADLRVDDLSRAAPVGDGAAHAVAHAVAPVGCPRRCTFFPPSASSAAWPSPSAPW